MRKLRRLRLPSHTAVAAYTALFVAVGGSAYAATQLPKNSVGTKQLKKKSVATSKLKGNAVTKNKIKKNSIVRAKIRNSAVDAAKLAGNAVIEGKIAANAVTGGKINAATTPFSRIVHEARGSGTVGLVEGKPVIYPLQGNSYTQEANRDDSYVGAADITFQPGCAAPRQAAGIIVLDPADPNEPGESDVVAVGGTTDEAGGEVSKRIQIGSGESGGAFQRDVPVNHTVYLGVIYNCTAGEGAVATYGGIDVIGTK